MNPPPLIQPHALPPGAAPSSSSSNIRSTALDFPRELFDSPPSDDEDGDDDGDGNGDSFEEFDSRTRGRDGNMNVNVNGNMPIGTGMSMVDKKDTFKTIQSPLIGLPPLLAPTSSAAAAASGASTGTGGTKKSPPARIQTDFTLSSISPHSTLQALQPVHPQSQPQPQPPSQSNHHPHVHAHAHALPHPHPIEEVLPGNYYSPNSAPPTHSTFRFDLAGVPGVPDLPPGFRGEKGEKNGMGEPVVVYQQSSLPTPSTQTQTQTQQGGGEKPLPRLQLHTAPGLGRSSPSPSPAPTPTPTAVPAPVPMAPALSSSPPSSYIRPGTQARSGSSSPSRQMTGQARQTQAPNRPDLPQRVSSRSGNYRSVSGPAVQFGGPKSPVKSPSMGGMNLGPSVHVIARSHPSNTSLRSSNAPASTPGEGISRRPSPSVSNLSTGSGSGQGRSVSASSPSGGPPGSYFKREPSPMISERPGSPARSSPLGAGGGGRVSSSPLDQGGLPMRKASLGVPSIQTSSMITSTQQSVHANVLPVIGSPPRPERSLRRPTLTIPGSSGPVLNQGRAEDEARTPTDFAVETIEQEMSSLRSNDRDEQEIVQYGEKGKGPVSPTPRQYDLGRDGSILNRPKPKPKSSAYRASPSRSPTPQQDGFSSPFKPELARYRSEHRRTGPAVLRDLIREEGVQAALLPHLNIPSFLALLTSVDKDARKEVSGEVVGKWVVRNWGLSIVPRDVPQWPGLGVWEGFLESLLHNAEAYVTYPQHFQPLLQHLCLSYSLVVLFLRALPIDAFPSTPPFPFEDEMTLASTGMPKSVSSLSIASSVPNRKGPGSGWDSGAPSRPSHIPRAERPFELVMPEPLGAPKNDVDQIETIAPSAPPPVSAAQKHRRRSSIGSASIISWTGKARRGSVSSQGTALTSPAMSSSAFTPMSGVQKKFPPVSFPSAKRYVFKGYGDPQTSRSRTFSESGSRPGSIFSVEESIAPRSRYGDTQSIVPSLPRFGKRPPSSEVGSSWGRPGAGRHSPTIASGLRITSMNGDRTNHNYSPDYGRWGARTPEVIEPAFDKPLPYVVGRTPVLRIFVPLSPEIPTWPCAEGARRARSELERCGAWGKLRLGDVIVNTALSEPLIPRNIMLYIPTMQPFLCPLEYRYAEQGHLPGYLDAFTIPPSFYYPLLFAGRYVIHLDLGPWADAAADTLRLAFARSDITTTRGDKVTAKRYLHVIGFQITPQTRHQAVEEWYGMVSIEAEGTAEGRKELLRRLGRTPEGNKIQAHKGPFEIVREKSLGGNVWLRLISEASDQLR